MLDDLGQSGLAEAPAPDAGWASAEADRDTAEFAVESLRQW